MGLLEKLRGFLKGRETVYRGAGSMALVDGEKYQGLPLLRAYTAHSQSDFAKSNFFLGEVVLLMPKSQRIKSQIS